MESFSSRARLLKRHGLAILFLVFLFGAYYSFHVPSQRAYFTSRSFRLLVDMSDQIRETIANLESALANIIAMADKAEASHSPSDEDKPAKPENALQRLGVFQTNVSAAITLIPHLALVHASVTDLPAGPRGLRLNVTGHGIAPQLELEYSGGTNREFRIKARSELRRLIEPIIRSAEFDEVLLLDATQNVLLQRGASELRMTKLHLPSDALDKSFQTNLLESGSVDYKLFLQPLQLPAAAAAGPSPSQTNHLWLLCGLVKAGRFRAETMEVHPSIVLLFVSLALLLVLSWPLLNVVSMGLREALRIGGIFLLAFSTLFVIGVATLYLLVLHSYFGLECELDRGLEALAKEIQTNFNEELESVFAQLDKFNRAYRGFRAGEATKMADVLADTRLIPLGTNSLADPYPYFRMVFWADTNGMQVAKWTVRNENTPMISVAAREYFRRVMGGQAWAKAFGSNSANFYLQPIYSRNTGEHLAIFSMAGDTNRTLMAAMDLRLLSLMDTVVPPGFGYCVIDQKGNVLFHADEKRNLRENFFVECGQSHVLRAAVAGRLNANFDGSYFRRPHSFHVRPMDGLPWSLAVFRDERLLGTTQLEWLAVSGILYALYAVLVFLVALAVYYCPGQQTEWVWPDSKRLASYHLLVLANGALLTLGVLGVVAGLTPGVSLLVTVAVPATALALAYWIVQHKVTGPDWLKLSGLFPFRRLPFRGAYVAAIGTLLILIAILPAFGFFKIVFDKETELFVKHAQLQLARDLENRVERITREVYGDPGPAGAARPLALQDPAGFLRQRLARSWDVYQRFFCESGLRAQAQASCSGVSESLWRDGSDRFLELLRPHFNETDVETRALFRATAADGAWHWHRHRSELELCKPGLAGHLDGGNRGLRLRSKVPALPHPWALLFFGLPALALGAFWIAHTVAQRLLLLGVGVPAKLAADPVGRGKFLVLGPARTGKSAHLDEQHFAVLQPGAHQKIDLRKAEDRAWLEPSRLDQLLQERDHAVVIDHLEYNQDDPAFNRAKLRLLEQLIQDEKRAVILVSSVEPRNFSIEDPAASEEQKKSAGSLSERERWAEVLTIFKRICHDDKTWLSDTAAPPGGTSHLAKASFRALWATCSPTERRILFHVAQGQLIHSEQPELPALLERGLLVRTPELQLVNPSFARYVLATFRPERELADETFTSLTLWQSARGPALTVLVLLAAFIFMTQRELWNTTTGLIPAFLGGLGAVAQLFNHLQKLKLKKAAESQGA